MKKCIFTLIGGIFTGIVLCLAAAKYLPLEDEELWF